MKEVTGIRRRSGKQLLDERKEAILKVERGRIRSHSVKKLGLEEAVDLSEDRVLDPVMQMKNLYLVK